MATKRKNTERYSNVWEVKPEFIQVIEGFNRRQNYGDMGELKQSIRVNGVLEPLTVVDIGGDYFELFDGYRRFEAVNQLIEQGVPIETIPCKIMKKGTTREEGMIMTIVSSNGGKPHEAIELAEFYKQLINWGWTQAKIAERTGKSQGHVSQTLALLEAPEMVRDAMREGDISPTEVQSLIKESRDQEDPAEFQREEVAKIKKSIADNGGKKPRKPRQKSAPGTDKKIVEILKEEFSTSFPDPNKYYAFVKDNPVLAGREHDLYNAGRISMLCELAKDGATVKDLLELLGDCQTHESLEIGVEDLELNDEEIAVHE